MCITLFFVTYYSVVLSIGASAKDDMHLLIAVIVTTVVPYYYVPHVS